MTRINRDPYTGGHLFALANRVTCLLDNEEAVTATVRALEEDGVATDDIDIFTGEAGARALDLFGREHGRVVRLLRTLEAAVGEERETTQRIDQALRKGATLLCVRVKPAAPGMMDVLAHPSSLGVFQRKKSDEKARALRVLKALHAHEIHYWGTWAFEDVPST
jgi:hypothetical protein